jgi:hypothetical protein
VNMLFRPRRVRNNLGVVVATWLLLSLVFGSQLYAQGQSAEPQPAPAQAPPATAQPPEPPPLPPPGQPLTPNQLDGLVAPIALYPDPLISQILVAATYPREVTLALQWLRQHPDLKGQELTMAAQQQPWDPSIQALVVFPGVLQRLNQDKVWTTNLGNAFLAQQADVMRAVQRMRRAAKDAGKLATNGRMRVVETTDSGETIIEIVPARPDVLFVPVYNPAWIWGPPLWYPYPRWFWGPPPVAAGVWFGFGGAVSLGAYFGPAWGGWGAWGWHPGWVNNNVVVNNTFITRNNTTNITNVNNTSVNNTNNTNINRNVNNNAVWAHDPAHRQGVPYSNNTLAQRYHGTSAATPRTQNYGQRAVGRTGGGARPLAQPRAAGRVAQPRAAGGRH